MNVTNNTKKIICAMLFAYSLGLFYQIKDYIKILNKNWSIINNKNTFGLDDIGLIVVVAILLIMSYRENNILLRVIYALAAVPFVLNYEVLYNFDIEFMFLLKIIITSILILLMFYYLYYSFKQQRRSRWKTRRFWWHGKTKLMNNCKFINKQINVTKLIVVL